MLARPDVELGELFSYNVLPAFTMGAREVVFVSEQGDLLGVPSLDDLLRHLTDRSASDPEASVLL